MVAGLLNVDLRHIENFKEEKIKSLSSVLFDDSPTIRQLLIGLSEDFMKVHYGREVFGNLLWNEAKNWYLTVALLVKSSVLYTVLVRGIAYWYVFIALELTSLVIVVAIFQMECVKL